MSVLQGRPGRDAHTRQGPYFSAPNPNRAARNRARLGTRGCGASVQSRLCGLCGSCGKICPDHSLLPALGLLCASYWPNQVSPRPPSRVKARRAGSRWTEPPAQEEARSAGSLRSSRMSERTPRFPEQGAPCCPGSTWCVLGQLPDPVLTFHFSEKGSSGTCFLFRFPLRLFRKKMFCALEACYTITLQSTRTLHAPSSASNSLKQKAP